MSSANSSAGAQSAAAAVVGAGVLILLGWHALSELPWWVQGSPQQVKSFLLAQNIGLKGWVNEPQRYPGFYGRKPFTYIQGPNDDEYVA